MEVSVTKTTTGYDVTIGEKTVTLPLDSEMKTLKKRGIKIGVTGNWLEIDTYANEIDHTTTEGEPAESILSEDDADDEEREDIVLKLTAAWTARNEEQDGGRSRVNRKTRRSKGKRGNTKRSKLRKLASRRR
jgi:hypothetical protein